MNYSSADTSGLPGGEPAEDLFVEVEGPLTPTGGEMLADVEIELGDELEVEDADEIEVTGFVTDRTLWLLVNSPLGIRWCGRMRLTIFVDGTAGDIAVRPKSSRRRVVLENSILFAHGKSSSGNRIRSKWRGR